MSYKKYFSYVRVSTQRQGQLGTSLVEQQASIERFAQSWNLPIVQRFEELETAAKQGRPVFLAMLKLLRAGKADGVIIHKIDRSARNLKDWADLGTLIDNGLEVHFASESLDLTSRGGRLSADIQAVVASDYIRNLREETRKGIYGRLKQGIFPFQAPVGYLDRGAAQPKSTDPVAGPLIRKAFDLYASNRWSLRMLSDEVERLGLRSRSGKKITANGLFTILHNPFYIGLIRIQKTGEVFEGVHRPLITKRLFDRVQDILAERNVPKFTIHNFTFRRMIRCRKCGNLLIGELQKQRVYYRCQRRGCTPSCLKEETVLDTIGREFKRLELNKLEFQFYRQESTKLFVEWKAESESVRAAMTHRQGKIKDRQTRLVDSYMDGILEREEYLERKAALIVEGKEVAARLAEMRENWESVPTRFDEFLELANSAYLSFISAPPDLKRELVETVTSNLTANGKLLSVKLESPFEHLVNRPPVTGGRPRRDTDRTSSAFVRQLFKLFVESEPRGDLKRNLDVGLTT